jgi:hypothetical protein
LTPERGQLNVVGAGRFATSGDHFTAGDAVTSSVLMLKQSIPGRQLTNSTGQTLYLRDLMAACGPVKGREKDKGMVRVHLFNSWR